MKSKWQTISSLLLSVMMLLCALLPLGCDSFIADGGSDDGIIFGGYFYMLDRESARLIMLDSQLRELKTWDIYRMAQDSSVQGLTFDGAYLWIASAGNSDQLFRVDATEDTLIKLRTLSAPPQKRGTIRDLAWDGANLWAVNSGSLTSSVPATLYKLDPLNGTILNEYLLPTHDPRALTYVNAFVDEYGRTASAGIVYADVTTNMVYKLLPELSAFDTVFSSPVPPRGASYVYPYGLTNDGMFYWLVNSSNTADHLYKLSYRGHIENRIDLPYTMPGSIVYSKVDIRKLPAPIVTAVSPNNGVAGRSLSVDVLGNEFVNKPGLSVSMGAGITVDSLNYISATQIKAYITIDNSATAGKRNVTVTNPGGNSATVTDLFEVTLTPPVYNIWLVEQDLDSLYHLRFEDTVSVVQRWNTRSFAAGGSPQGLAYDGTNIWMCASGTDRKIYKLNTDSANLTVVKSFPGPTASGTLRGIVWENGSLWVAVSAMGATARIYKIDPDSGKVQDSLTAPGIEPRGIVFRNGELYCNDTSLDSVFVYDTAIPGWRGVFATPTPPGGTTTNRFATGMTWDGNYFWIANSSNDFDHVFKISPTGITLQYFASPRIGPAQVTGIVSTLN